MMLKKKVLLISNPKLKKYYKKIITTYGSKLENIDENYSIFKKKIPEFTAVVSLPSYFVKAEIFNLAKQLDWIHFGGAGIENALIPELINSNIVVTNGKIAQGPSIADQAIALCLSLTRRIKPAILEKKIISRPIELKNKKVLIHGLGGVGMLIAERIKTFGCYVIGIDKELKPLNSFVDECYRPDKLIQNLQKSDIVFVSSPLTSETEGIFGKKEFNKMKKESYIINVARGKIIDTNSLVKALKSKEISGDGLDVTDPEPLNSSHILRKLDNVIVTPHNAGFSDMNRDRSISIMKENVKRYFQNNSLLNEVNKLKGY